MDHLFRAVAIDDYASTLQEFEALPSAEPDFELAGCYQTVPEPLADVGIDDRLNVVVLGPRLVDNSDPAQSVLSLELVIDHVLIFLFAESSYLVREAVRIGVIGVTQKSETPETVVSAI